MTMWQQKRPSKYSKQSLLYGHIFKSLENLNIKLDDYMNAYNNIRIHSTLGYLTPV
ncbi:IS3 family transposase [Alkaliphilus oremlandii]|uniref:IS3 family transposase n=1 Tax=Alkaliphilus oremlandii TaxID=461876 RepID=UPI000A053C67